MMGATVVVTTAARDYRLPDAAFVLPSFFLSEHWFLDTRALAKLAPLRHRRRRPDCDARIGGNGAATIATIP